MRYRVPSSRQIVWSDWLCTWAKQYTRTYSPDCTMLQEDWTIAPSSCASAGTLGISASTSASSIAAFFMS